MKCNKKFQFPDSAHAWRFLKACDEIKVEAGYPTFDERPLVEVNYDSKQQPALAQVAKANSGVTYRDPTS